MLFRSFSVYISTNVAGAATPVATGLGATLLGATQVSFTNGINASWIPLPIPNLMWEATVTLNNAASGVNAGTSLTWSFDEVKQSP